MFLTWLLNTIAFVIIAELLPGFRIRSHGTAVVVAAVYGILQAGFRWALGVMLTTGLFGTVLVLGPLTVLTAPLFFLAWFVGSFLISVASLVITDKALEDFEMKNTATAVVAAVLLGLMNMVMGSVVH